MLLEIINIKKENCFKDIENVLLAAYESNNSYFK